MKTEELKRLAEAATPGPWAHGVTWIEHLGGIVALGNTARSKQDAAYVAAANPAAILELIAEIEYLRGKNREHFDAFTECNEELKRTIVQRDELLAALKACRKELSAWMRHHGEDIATQEAVAQARAAIAKAET